MSRHDRPKARARRGDGLRSRLSRRLGVALVAGAIGVSATACGGSPPAQHTPTPHDVAAIAGAVSDIVYQCQSVAAGFVAGIDAPSIRHDVTMLLHAYRGVRPDARIAIGPRRTTPRHELMLAQANLQAGCAAAQARRLDAGARQ